MLALEEIASQKRRLMFDKKKRKFFLVDFSGSDMAKDSSIVTKNFRVREYIKGRNSGDSSQEWLSVPESEIWSTKFLGLSDQGFQKLEFQNPAYAAASKLGGDPRKYNETFVVELNGCDYECSYCFIDRSLNKPELSKGAYLSAEEIIDEFLLQKAKFRKNGKELNVVRITGGEATSLVPEIIIDISNELKKRNLSKEVFVWIDCNLSTLTYLKNVEDELRDIFSAENIAIVGCLKAVGNQKTAAKDFRIITNTEENAFSKQFDVLDFLVNKVKADMYVYLVPIIQCETAFFIQRLYECLQKLREIDQNLPLRVNMLQVRNYSPVKVNMLTAFQEGRGIDGINPDKYEESWTDFNERQKLVTRLWFEHILPSFYKSEEINRFRSQVPLRIRQALTDVTSKASKEEIVYLFKSTWYPDFRQKILSLLSLPKGLKLIVEFDSKWLSAEIRNNVSKYKEKPALVIFLDVALPAASFYPLRKCQILEIIAPEEGATYQIVLHMEDFVIYSDPAKFNLEIRQLLFQSNLIAIDKAGNERLNQLVIPGDRSILDLSNTGNDQEKAWEQIVDNLSNRSIIVRKNNQPQFQQSIFFRTSILPRKTLRNSLDPKNNSFKFNQGTQYSVAISVYNPNAAKTITTETQKVTVDYDTNLCDHVGSEELELPLDQRKYTKYFDFRTKENLVGGQSDIIAKGSKDTFNTPLVQIPYSLTSKKAEMVGAAFVLALGILVLGIADLLSNVVKDTYGLSGIDQITIQIILVVVGTILSAVPIAWLEIKRK
jgi:uncharacterized Fe-S cluster-containing radical SAM superfamily protein